MYDLQRKVAIASPGSWFHSLVVLLKRRIYQYIFIVSWRYFDDHDQPCSGAIVISTCHLRFPRRFSGVYFEQGPNASYLSALRQVFPRTNLSCGLQT